MTPPRAARTAPTAPPAPAARHLARRMLPALSLSASSAWAHGPFGADASIWTSSWHLLTSPLSMACLLGLMALLAGLREPHSTLAAGFAAVAAATATFLWPVLPPGTLRAVAPGAAVLIGLCAALALTPPRVLGYGFALMAGFAAGTAAEVDNPRWQELIGMGATVLLLVFWLLAAFESLMRRPHLQAALPIARRVLGSWVAAIGLLLGALLLLGKAA